MDFGELLDFLFRDASKQCRRGLGGLLLLMNLAYILGGGFREPLDGVFLSPAWFRGVFVVLLAFTGFIGLLLLLSSFSKDKPDNRDSDGQ